MDTASYDVTMNSITVVFNGTTFRRYPDSERRSDRVYFTPGQSDRAKGVGRLHEEIWKAANGAIPEGHHIHHKDHDPLNNELPNLVAMTAADHHREHAGTPERRARYESEEWHEHLASIRPLAAEWHRSPEGREWHKLHGKAVAAKQPVKAGVCEHCGDAFLSKRPVSFCSNRCKAAARRASGADNETRKCVACGNEFTVNKYAKSKSCSRSCAHKRTAPSGTR